MKQIADRAMRMLWVLSCSLLASACATTDADAGAAHPARDTGVASQPPRGDGGDVPMWLGRCVRVDNGAECRGADDETPRFVTLEAGDVMHAVLGPQASIMLVFMLQAEGVEPGDPSALTSTDNPRLEIELIDSAAGSIVGRYRGRVTFAVDGTTQRLTANEPIFVVLSELVASLVGKTLTVNAELVDKLGTTLQAESSIVLQRE